MKSKKKKILLFTIITLLILILFLHYHLKYLNPPIGDGEGIGISGKGCDLSTQHVEYDEKSGKQICVPNEENS